MMFRASLVLILFSFISLRAFSFLPEDYDSDYYAEILGADVGNDILIKKEASSFIVNSFLDVPWIDTSSIGGVFKQEDTVVLLVKNSNSIENHQIIPYPSQEELAELGRAEGRFPVEALDVDGDGILDFIVDESLVGKKTLFSGTGNRDITSIQSTLVNKPVEFLPVKTVKQIQGSAGVDAFGNATYGLSLELPKSPTGLTPNIGVSYNSAGGYGNLGMGWSLSSISVISRCTDNYDRNPTPVPIKHLDSDQFCLNGKYIDGDVISGQGQLEIDDFRRIGRAGSGESIRWTVYDTSGHTTLYKSFLDGLIFLPYEKFETGHPENKIVYTYLDQDKEVSLSRIDYAYSDEGNKFSVDINYHEASAGRYEKFIAGRSFKTGRLVSDVVVKGSGKAINEYHFFYDSNTNDSAFVSKLKGIQQCGFKYVGFQRVCGEPLELDWYDNNTLSFYDKFSSKVRPKNSDYHTESYLRLDFNGDGKTVLAKNNVATSPVFRYEGNKDAYVRLKYVKSQDVRVQTSDMSIDATVIIRETDSGLTTGPSYPSAQPTSVTVSFSLYKWVLVHEGVELEIENACLWIPKNSGAEKLIESRGTSIRAVSYDANADGLTDLALPVSGCNSLDESYAKRTVNSAEWYVYIASSLNGKNQYAKTHSLNATAYEFKKTGNINFSYVFDVKGGLAIPMRMSTSPVPTVLFKNTAANSWEIGNTTLQTTINPDVENDIKQDIPSERSISGDFNGDGLTDIIAAKYDWSKLNTRIENWQLYQNLGRSESGEIQFSNPKDIGLLIEKRVSSEEYEKEEVPATSQVLKTQVEVQMVDLTSDGLKDIVIFDRTKNSIKVCPQINGRVDRISCEVWGEIEDLWALLGGGAEFTDINGDGVLDLLITTLRGEGPTRLFGSKQLYRLGKQQNKNKINIIGDQNKSEFSYSPLTNVANYSYTNEEYIGPKSVVTSRKYTANNDAVATKTYTYKNGKLNYQGRGFLGFETINVKDSLTGFDVYSMYSWQFDRVGKPNYVRKSKNGAIVSSVLNTWLDDCNCSWLSRTDSKKYELKEGSTSQTAPYLNITKEYNRGANNELTRLVTKYQEAQGDLVTLKTIEDVYVYEYINKDKALIKQPSNSRRVINNHILNDKLSSKFKSNSNWVNRQYSIISNNYYPELEGGVAKSNRILKTEENDHDYNLKLTSEFDYNEYGVLLKTTTSGDSRAKHPIEARSTGIVEAFGFTDGLYPNATKDALGNVTKYTYHPNLGTVASITDPNGVVTRKSYGAFGFESKTSTDNQPAIVSSIGYCRPKGSLHCGVGAMHLPHFLQYKPYYWVKKISTDGSGITTIYDKKGNQLLTESNENRPTYVSTEYDQLGRKIAVSMPFKANHMPMYSRFSKFDLFNRATLVTKANGHKIESTFKLAAGTNTRVNTTKQTLYKADRSLDRTLTHEQRLNPLGQVKWVMGPLESASDERLDAYYRYDGMGNMNGALLFPGGGPASVGGTSSAVAADKHIQIDSNYDTAGNRIYLKDPSLGESFSKYDALGQLRYTLKGAAATAETPHDWTSRSYDLLGRMVQRDEQAWQGPFKSSHWYFDHSPECDLASQVGQLNVVGGLCKKTDGTFVERYGYNKNGQKTYQQTDAGYKEPFIFAYGYNDLGQLATETYPSKNTVKYNYSRGELANVSDDNGLLFTNLARDAFGNTVHRQYKNGLILKHRYDPASGLPVFHAQRNNGVGNQLSWNSAGWLTKSQESWGGGTVPTDAILSETDYGYDNYGRITSFTTNDGGENRAYTYDVLGNLETITKGYLTFKNLYAQTNGASPNAATGLMKKNGDGEFKGYRSGYSYDFKGNLERSTTGRYKYTAFNKPYYFHDGSIAYGPDHQRYKWTNRDGQSTYYINGGRYEMVANRYNHRSSEVAHLPGGIDFNGRLNFGNSAYKYLVKDHLGSTTLIYSDQNRISSGRGYYPFGDTYRTKVFATSGSETFVTGRLNYKPSDPGSKVRGFTGHEHMPGFINMNGRNFDQSNGRFNSADPMLQDPFNPQNFNRYSYVLNSPMGATDPSGYAAQEIVLNIGDLFEGVGLTEYAPVPYLEPAPFDNYFANEASSLVIGAENVLRFGANTLLALGESVLISTANDIDEGYSFVSGITGIHKSELYKTTDAMVPSLGKGVSFLGGLSKGRLPLALNTRYGPLRKGPLENSVVDNFRGGSYTASFTSENVTLYRVYGGEANMLGPYWTRTKPSGPLQSQLDSALIPSWGNTANNVVSIDVPKNTQIFEGIAGPQSTGVSQLIGGGNQVYIPQVNPNWIK